MCSCRQGITMGPSKTKGIQVDLATFTYILAYSGIFRHVQKLFTHIQNPV